MIGGLKRKLEMIEKYQTLRDKVIALSGVIYVLGTIGDSKEINCLVPGVSDSNRSRA